MFMKQASTNSEKCNFENKNIVEMSAFSQRQTKGQGTFVGISLARLWLAISQNPKDGMLQLFLSVGRLDDTFCKPLPPNPFAKKYYFSQILSFDPMTERTKENSGC